MTALFVNWDTGDDTTGNGSVLAPYKTRNKARTMVSNGANQIYVRRGTTEPLSATLGSFRSGASASAPFVYGVYGPERDGYAKVTATADIGDLMYILSGETNVLIEGWDFDGSDVVTRPFQAQANTAATTGITLRRCRFQRSSANGAFLDNKASGTYALSVTYEECVFERNAGHGAHATGLATGTYNKCRSSRNGARLATGGHGFSSHAYRDSFTTGWTLVSGNIYSRTYATTPLKVCAVQNSTYPILANGGATTTPSAGQYGVSGGALYINIGANPNGQLISIQTTASPAVTYQDCVAFDNLDNPNAPFREGHGFAADDFTTATFLRCDSYNNEGSGFSLNMGDSSVIRHCFAYGNRRAGIVMQRSGSNTVDANVVAGNDVSNYHGAQLVLFASALSNVVQNNILLAAGGDYVIYGDDQSLTNTIRNNALWGGAIISRGFALASSNVIADPRLMSVANPDAGLRGDSPCRGAGLFTAGARDRYGRRYAEPNIGPFAVIPRAA